MADFKKLSKLHPKAVTYEACFYCKEVFVNDLHATSAVFCPNCGTHSVLVKYLTPHEAERGLANLQLEQRAL